MPGAQKQSLSDKILWRTATEKYEDHIVVVNKSNNTDTWVHSMPERDGHHI